MVFSKKIKENEANKFSLTNRRFEHEGKRFTFLNGGMTAHALYKLLAAATSTGTPTLRPLLLALFIGWGAYNMVLTLSICPVSSIEVPLADRSKQFKLLSEALVLLRAMDIATCDTTSLHTPIYSRRHLTEVLSVDQIVKYRTFVRLKPLRTVC